MKKGFRILYDTIKKQWEVKYYGKNQEISYLDFGTGEEGILKCVKCHKVHWKDLKKRLKSSQGRI